MVQVKGLSLFQKTGLLAFCLFGIISTMASSLAAWTLYTRTTEEFLSKGSAIAISIAQGSQEILLVRDASTIQSMIDQYLKIDGVAYVFVVDADKLVISHTFVPVMPQPLMDLARHKAGQVRELKIEQVGRVIDICEPVLAGVAGFVHVGMNKDLIMDYFWEAVIKMQVMLFICFWICVGVLYVVTRRISRPLHLLTEHARKLEAHDFSATIDIRTHDEMEVLGRAMQSMGRELALLFSEMESEVDKASGELRDHMAYLSSIIDNLADGLLVVNPLGAVSIINPAMRDCFDLSSEGILGARVDAVFPKGVADLALGVRECSRDVLSAEIPLSRGRTGKAVASPVLAGDDTAPKCLGGVILIRDITREKELDRLKTDFISTVSHELRTPMTSVLGFSKIIRKKLEQSVFPALKGSGEMEKSVIQVRSNLDIIVSEAERLTELINDVLDIARMEAGKIQWHDRRISMVEVIGRSCDSTMGLWKRKGLACEVDVEDGLPDVYGDFDRLVQVVVNLISNALKFTEESPIICRARLEGGMVVVSVEDKGTGIAEADILHVFDKFKQVGDTLTSKPSGTGLGLPICRQIVERHGGRIWVESEAGKGSVFHFSIPMAHDDPDPDEVAVIACPGPDEAVNEPEQDDGSLILVVDDDPALTSYLTQVFSDQGFKVKAVYNGHDAVVQAQVLKPDLITMDIMMPGMDGSEAIRCLRSSLATRSIPILVISALSGGKEGGDLALVKPVDEERLIRAAKALIGRKSVKMSCMLLGDPNKCDLDGLSAICTGEMVFAGAGDVWDRVDRGFLGVIFVPAEELDAIHLKDLIRVPGISVVILPEFSCQ